MQKQVIFDRGPLTGGTAFVDPLHLITAYCPSEVPIALAAIEEASRQGCWLAGYLSYELGYFFESKLYDLIPVKRATPLLQFGVFERPLPALQLPILAGSRLTMPKPIWDQNRYNKAFDSVIAHLAAGDIYQANLTFPLDTRYTGSPIALYGTLRAKQAVPFGAFVDLGGPVLLSRSPELFFAVDASRQLCTKPMKGTAARGRTNQEDRKQREWLQKSEKNRAENAMIVDLMRNDMSKISEPGSVVATDLFEVETYATLHQMTSKIRSNLLPHITFKDILTAIFPSGSITGAPKIRAMQIIRELEVAARDAYCGAIGWISPGGAMAFNVAIRTVHCFDDGSARINVGGGIVYDSVADQEYTEALMKSEFAVVGEV